MSDERKTSGGEWPNLDDQAKADAGGGARGDRASVAGELQELGQRLAATARALWQSEQRQELQQEVADGLRMLRDQLSGAVDTVRTSTPVQSLKGQVEGKVDTNRANDVLEDMRAGLTGGLRTLNEQLQRFSERLEQRDAAASGATASGTGTTVAGTTAADVAMEPEVVHEEAVAPSPGLPTAPEGPAAEKAQ